MNAINQEKLKGYFLAIRKYPLTLLCYDSDKLTTHITFWGGIFSGLELFIETSIDRELSKWYKNQTSGDLSNLVWFEQFKIMHDKESEFEQIKALTDLIEQFMIDKGYLDYV